MDRIDKKNEIKDEKNDEMKFHITKVAGKKIQKNLAIALIAVAVILAVVCVFLIQDKKIQKNKLKELSDKIEEMEQVQVDTIQEELINISKYSAYELNYTSIIKFSDKNKFMGKDIPLTGNFFIATIDGKMNIGIDAEKVEISTSADADGKVTQVMLHVPHSEILDNYTIQDSLEIYDERNNIFNPVTVEDYSGLIIEAEEKQEQKVQESDVLQKSDDAVNNLLTTYIQAVYGNDIDIKYEYLQ